MSLARPTDRSIVKVSGEEARSFLDRLVTCDLDHLAAASSRYGALLTPQGKIISDFIAFDAGAMASDAILLDVPASCASDLIKRLNMYKLRAKAAVADVSHSYTILVGWGETSPPTGEHHLSAPDPRLRRLGWRAVVGRDGLMDASAPDDGEAAYHAHRVSLGIPEGGRDFAFNDAFPHEALMDQLQGVDFDKGCYIGQEVVSRMQHRGTARTRVVSLAFRGESAASPGQDVVAGERSLGTVGSVSGERALATVRLDRAADALTAGGTPTVGGVPVSFVKPDWVRFPYPNEMAAAEP